MVEGRGSKDFSTLKRMMYREPKVLHALLDKLTECSVDYLNAQIDAGAQAVQLFDTWAGLLTAAEYREWVLPRHREIAERVDRARAPLILYINTSIPARDDPPFPLTLHKSRPRVDGLYPDFRTDPGDP